jgi:hypothetical protein
LSVQSVAPKTVITEDALATLGERLTTSLQFQYYLTRALEESYKVDQKPAGAGVVGGVLAKGVDGLEPTLTRQGYNAKVLAELLNANRARSNRFQAGQLAPGQTQELQGGTAGGGNPALAILINLVQTGCYRSVLK